MDKEEKRLEIKRLNAEFYSLSYTCYCGHNHMCRYCTRQIEISKRLKELDNG